MKVIAGRIYRDRLTIYLDNVDIANMLESSVVESTTRNIATTPDSALIDLFDLVNEKLVVNIAVLEVVLYGSMVVSIKDGDYSLPKPWTSKNLGVMRMSMQNRSLSAAFAYEGHRELLVNPASYIKTNRMDHPFDGLLLPQEVFGRD